MRRFERFKENIDEKGMDPLPYYDLRSVISEVTWVDREFRKRGLPIIDITGKTVEELAVMVLTELDISNDDLMYRS